MTKSTLHAAADRLLEAHFAQKRRVTSYLRLGTQKPLNNSQQKSNRSVIFVVVMFNLET